MNRLYIIPVYEHDPGIGTIYRGPKYLWRFPRLGIERYPGLEDVICIGRSYYGEEDHMLVACTITQAEHDILKDLTGVLAIPENIDQNLSPAAVIITQNFLEDCNLPADWLNTLYDYRVVLRMILGIFRLFQRYSGIEGPEKMWVGASLNVKLKNIPVFKRLNLQAAADQLGIDYGSLTGNDTLRAFLKLAGQHYATHEFVLSSSRGSYII